jgi:membrane fusion protein (multidrug efflux system)
MLKLSGASDKTVSVRFFWFLVLMSTMLVGCGENTPEVPPRQVVVVRAELKDFPIYGRYVGVTQASLEVEIRARVDGFVEDKLFLEGSVVNEGDVLYRIDKRSYQASVNRLKARLDHDKAALAKAGRDVERIKPLYEQNAASQLDYDNALSAEEKARASVAASQAELEEDELELSYTEIRAPIRGLVGESLVDIGALVGSGGQSLLTTVRRINPIEVRFNMSALDYLHARRRITTWSEQREADEKGQFLKGFVRITLPDDSEYPYMGDVRFTDPQVNPETGTFAVHAILPNPNRELLPGQHTRVMIKLEELSDVVVIPEQTIQIEQGGANVMVVLQDNIVEQRFVMPSARMEGEVVIDSGLTAGEMVIVEGIHRVHHGQKVIPISQEQYEQQKARQKEEQLRSE